MQDRLGEALNVPIASEPAVVPPRPEATDRLRSWTARRITALVVGALLVLVSLGLLGGGATALWVDRMHRDSAGYVTTDAHHFSTTGSALVTDPIDLGSPGVEWLYSPFLLDEVRIRATPVDPSSTLFMGIGPSADVDGYLAGVSHTLISEFWGDKVQAIGGDRPSSTPETQDFWIASATGPGAQTLTWEPANGSWSIVVMHADGGAGIDVGTDLGAKMPDLVWLAVGLLGAGGVLLACGMILIGRAIRGRVTP